MLVFHSIYVFCLIPRRACGQPGRGSVGLGCSARRQVSDHVDRPRDVLQPAGSWSSDRRDGA